MPWIQLGGRPDLEEDPPRLDFFPIAFAVAFFARSNATVFSFLIAADRARSSGAGVGADAVEKTEKEEEEWERTVQKPRTDVLYEVASE